MPRQRRMLSDSKIYHVMIRGIEKRNIFMDNDDRVRFLDTIIKKNKEQKFSVYAYCLMDNHVHLLLNEGVEDIALIMKRINVSYAYYFNKKYKRVGHLFQDRFKSEPIESDQSLLAVARYIHNNPVKAFIVKEPGLYRWSSYNSYIEGKQNIIVETKPILDLLTQNSDNAVRAFIEFTNQESNDEFIEYTERNEHAEIEGEKDVMLFINDFLCSRGYTMNTLREWKNREMRDELIKLLKEKSNLSVRQLVQILGMDRNIVQRAR